MAISFCAVKVNGEVFVARKSNERHADLLWQAIRKLAGINPHDTLSEFKRHERDIIANRIDKGEIECLFGYVTDDVFEPDDSIYTQTERRRMHLS